MYDSHNNRAMVDSCCVFYTLNSFYFFGRRYGTHADVSLMTRLCAFIKKKLFMQSTVI